MTIKGDHLKCTPVCKPIWERTSIFFCKTVHYFMFFNMCAITSTVQPFPIVLYLAELLTPSV